jgi:hypothetical protein
VQALSQGHGSPGRDTHSRHQPYIPAFDSIPDALSGWVSETHIGRIRETSLQAHQDLDKKLRQG